MDRNFYFQTRTAEHQREIAHELATRAMLKELKHEPLTRKQARGLMLRVAPVVILMAMLLIAVIK